MTDNIILEALVRLLYKKKVITSAELTIELNKILTKESEKYDKQEKNDAEAEQKEKD